MVLIQKQDPELPLALQADLLSVNRTSLYYKQRAISGEVIRIRHRIDEIHTNFPTYGSRIIRDVLRNEGIRINRKAVQRHMQAMVITVIYPGPNLSKRNQLHRVYPYLLRNLDINRKDQVWQTDVTYIRLHSGWVYLTAVIDVHSRFIVDWELSTTIDSTFILTMLKRAFSRGRPDILNSDQGCQYTSDRYIELVKAADVKVSMDSRGRATDNIYIERFWRTVKQQEVYLNEYSCPKHARQRIAAFIHVYNYFRPHQGLGGKTPGQVYKGIAPIRFEDGLQCSLDIPLTGQKLVHDNRFP
jgi:putative transposase